MPALMRSELPEVARTRHHWIVLTRPPHRQAVIALAVLLLAAAIWPWPWAVLAIGTLGTALLLRIRAWRAELIILTHKRIVRMQGVPETTVSEASLRIDRVSGVRLMQTVPGKILGYGSIELEAPGQHPDTHRLSRIAQPRMFYGQLRATIFNDHREPGSERAAGVDPWRQDSSDGDDGNHDAPAQDSSAAEAWGQDASAAEAWGQDASVESGPDEDAAPGATVDHTTEPLPRLPPPAADLHK